MKAWSALRAALCVAATYGNFLIFAQFAFVELLRKQGVAVNGERALLGGMALAGIIGGFLMAQCGPGKARIGSALVLTGLAAALAPLCQGMAAFTLIAVMTGLGLGAATVGLSASLRHWCSLRWVGPGVGLGYALCNLPWVFTTSAAQQAWIGAAMAFFAVLILPAGGAAGPWVCHASPSISRWAAVLMFAALVWLDSAAFFIIQHASELKAATWHDAMLWRNAGLHLVAACVAGEWLSRARAVWLLPVAWALLACAALLVNHPDSRLWAGWIYPVAVSFYCVALIAWPGWFGGAQDDQSSGWYAAWLFAIAGWIGSANGIGMAETLQRVPPLFVAATGVVMLCVLGGTKYWRSSAAVALVLGVVAFGWESSAVRVSDPVERGRQVYLEEGCIHCHSQYVRPRPLDQEYWGPADDPGRALAGQPVLIGNRRQGPDLARVGARRSPEWLRQHFRDPRLFAHASVMPSYAHLESDGRLEDLVAYLRATGVPAMGGLMTHVAQWKPSEGSTTWGDKDGAALFARHCAVCHGAQGHGEGILSKAWLQPPANLVDGPFVWSGPGEDQRDRIARVIKYGIIGTDMPGHETLNDEQISALVAEVLRLRGERKN